MKISLNRVLFANALSHVSGFIPGKSPKPILSNAKIEVVSGKATLIATDLDIGIRYDIPDVECSGNTEALLPARRVSDIVRELRDERITIDVDDKSLRIRGERSDFKLPSADPAEFPPVAGFDDENYYEVSGKTLRTMIRRTSFATDVDNGRFSLAGILYEFSDKQLELVATDGRRLAVMASPSTQHGKFAPPAGSTIVPDKVNTLLERIIPDTDDMVHIAVHHPSNIVFRSANATIYSRLVEGRFPQYRSVIPRSHRVSVDLLTDSLASVVRQAMIVTNEESRGVDFDFRQGSLVLASETADVGTSKIELPISYDSDPVTVRFDPRFVADALKALTSGTMISLKLSTEEDPGVLTTDDGYTYVIMPLRREG